jgi:folate-binding Fe-S cluster repair protein YgfZ
MPRSQGATLARKQQCAATAVPARRAPQPHQRTPRRRNAHTDTQHTTRWCTRHRTTQGKDAVPFLESLVTGDIASLADGTGSLSVFTNETGGIIDDTVITKVCDGVV